MNKNIKSDLLQSAVYSLIYYLLELFGNEKQDPFLNRFILRFVTFFIAINFVRWLFKEIREG